MTQLNADAYHKAEEIAGEGKYEDIVEALRNNGVLSSYVEQMRNLYGVRLNSDHFTMTDRDWEMLAVLGLYDADTLEHSIRTFELSYYLVDHSFKEPSGETIRIGDFLGSADVSREQFLRAALFHDIGKVIIPRKVLRNTLDDEEVLVKMFPEDNFAGKEAHEKKAILQTLYANGIRPIDVVPLNEVFAGEQYAELLCHLEKRGFSKTATLKDVIRMHEPESKRILALWGYETEGELAGHHHNYGKEGYQHVVSVPGMTFGVADLIRIADVTDALQSGRWYKRPFSELDVLFILTKDAEAGKVNPRLAYLWVSDRYRELRGRKDISLTAGGDETQEEARAVEVFLEQQPIAAA
ncbi:MAG: HD domain-containing protein [Parcubacteria group bacterium]|nr:HD domain-containing protein [Parcubacteria group bacterium]